MLLLRVKLWKLQSRHVINEEIVTDLTVSEDPLLVSLSYSLGKDTRVFSIEKQVYSSQLAVLLGFIIPKAGKNVSFFFIGIDEN